jgi:lipoteichoic acid synthase
MLRTWLQDQTTAIVRRYKSVRYIWAAAAVLALVLLICRIVILWTDLSNQSPLSAIAMVLRASRADWAVTWMVAMVLVLIAQSTRWHRAVSRTYLILSLLLAAVGVSNIFAVKMLGGPITAQWLAFADLSNSSFVATTLLSALKPIWILGGLLLVVLYLGLVWAVAHLMRDRTEKIAAIFLVPFLLGAISSGETDQIGKESNPVVAMMISFVSPSSFSAAHFNDKAGSTAAPQSVESFTETLPPVPRPDTSDGKVKNVIIYVMESTGARFVSGYDPAQDVTPVITALLPNSLRVSDAYAHVPASAYSLVSLLAAITPELSAYGMSDNRPDFKFQGLPAVFAAQGYKTGFFSSSDNRFQNYEGFAAKAGFQTIQDYRAFNCATDTLGYEGSTENFLDTSDDHCLVAPFLDFLDKDPDQPFVSLLWTGMTHFPYYPGQNPKQYVDDTSQNNYLNALHEGDATLGELIQGLRDRGLFESTLIVIVGDHGEAFGEHGQFSHATDIYEENLRIPMILVNPNLFKGETAQRIVGLSAVAPTVTDLLGFTAPKGWQAQSLFAANRANGLMFFTAWNGMQIGYREGSTKFVLNTNTNVTRLTDLATDPHEQTDLSSTNPDDLAKAGAKLASWIRLHDMQTQALLGNAPAPATVAEAPAQITIQASGTKFKDPPQVEVRLDGVEVGTLSVDGALSNADAAVDWPSAIAQAKVYSLPAEIGACPKKLELTFLNDDWAGDGLTGDTNLFLGSVTIGSKVYYPWQYKLETAGVGNVADNVYYLWQAGTVQLPLEQSTDCIVGDLAALK